MTTLYTQAEREQLEKILHRLADEQAPTPKLNPAPSANGWTAETMLRDLAVRGYISWWLTVQPLSEPETEAGRAWWRERITAACWSWQSACLLAALREQADAVGKPDKAQKAAVRIPAEWKDVDQVVLDIARAADAGDGIGEDLWSWASGCGVYLEDLTAAAVAELERAGADR